MRQISKLKLENMTNFRPKLEGYHIQSFRSLTNEDELNPVIVEEDGHLNIDLMVSKKIKKKIETNRIEMWVESRPRDPSRTLSISTNYLRWMEHPLINGKNHRVCLRSEKDLTVTNYVEHVDEGHLRRQAN